MLLKTLANQKQVLMDKLGLSPDKEAGYFPCSFEDPRVKETMRKLRERSDWMERMGVPRLVDLNRYKFTTAAQTDVGQTFDRIRRLKTGAARRVK
jgi:hypothetical protein